MDDKEIQAFMDEIRQTLNEQGTAIGDIQKKQSSQPSKPVDGGFVQRARDRIAQLETTIAHLANHDDKVLNSFNFAKSVTTDEVGQSMDVEYALINDAIKKADDMESDKGEPIVQALLNLRDTIPMRFTIPKDSLVPIQDLINQILGGAVSIPINNPTTHTEPTQ